MNYISCLDLDCLSISLSYRFASCCFQSLGNIVCEHPMLGVLKMPRVSNKYGFLDVKCKGKWFLDLFLITSVHSNIGQLTLQAWRLTKFRSGWSDGSFWKLNENRIFSKVFAQSPLLPCILHTVLWQIDLTGQSRLMVNSLYQNVLCRCYFLIWCGREARALIVLNIDEVNLYSMIIL